MAVRSEMHKLARMNRFSLELKLTVTTLGIEREMRCNNLFRHFKDALINNPLKTYVQTPGKTRPNWRNLMILLAIIV